MHRSPPGPPSLRTALVGPALLTLIMTAPLVAQSARGCGEAGGPAAEDGVDWFPERRLFCPLLADRREAGSRLGALELRAPWLRTTVALAAVGDEIPLFGRTTGGTDLQIGISTVVVGLFDLDRPSFDFVHADFLVGLPVTARIGPWAVRVRPYHWSSHIGDEFLLRDPPPVERREISLGALETLVSRDLGPARATLGVEAWLDRVPDDLPSWIGVGALDVRPDAALLLGDRVALRPVTGLHVRTSAVERGPSLSLRAGVELGRAHARGERRWGIVFEWFDGQSPWGQFYREPLRFTGVSLYFN